MSRPIPRLCYDLCDDRVEAGCYYYYYYLDSCVSACRRGDQEAYSLHKDQQIVLLHPYYPVLSSNQSQSIHFVFDVCEERIHSMGLFTVSTV